MGRTIFDGISRWRLMDRGSIMSQPKPQLFVPAARGRSLIPDCRSVWGDRSSLSEFTDMQPGETIYRTLKPASEPAPAVVQTQTPSAQVVALRQAAENATPFCEICDPKGEAT